MPTTLPLDHGAKDLQTVEPSPDVTGLALVIERLAARPEVDVAKLEKIIELQERILKHQAKAEFDAAFAQMQGELPVITERGEIKVNGQLRSKYATNEDIQEQVKPILQRHGFALRFRNEVVDGNKLKVVGILSHKSGHSEQDEFVTKADDSGSKNDIQAIGSARSYGQRYTTTALLNIATRGQDDDGVRASRLTETNAPAGYDDWLGNLEAVADEGMPAFSAMWNKSKEEYRKYLAQTAPQLLAKIRTKAGKVGKAS